MTTFGSALIIILGITAGATSVTMWALISPVRNLIDAKAEKLRAEATQIRRENAPDLNFDGTRD